MRLGCSFELGVGLTNEKRRRRSTVTEVVLDGVDHVLIVVPMSIPNMLSEAERTILEAAALGRSNDEIAAARGVSVRTVAKQLSSAFRKVGVGSRSELVARLARGWSPIEERGAERNERKSR